MSRGPATSAGIFLGIAASIAYRVTNRRFLRNVPRATFTRAELKSPSGVLTTLEGAVNGNEVYRGSFEGFAERDPRREASPAASGYAGAADADRVDPRATPFVLAGGGGGGGTDVIAGDRSREGGSLPSEIRRLDARTSGRGRMATDGATTESISIKGTD